MDEKDEIVELDNAWAIIEIPETCVELTLQCKVYLDGKLQTVIRTMSMKDIKEAFAEYEDAEEAATFCRMPCSLSRKRANTMRRS